MVLNEKVFGTSHICGSSHGFGTPCGGARVRASAPLSPRNAVAMSYYFCSTFPSTFSPHLVSFFPIISLNFFPRVLLFVSKTKHEPARRVTSRRRVLSQHCNRLAANGEQLHVLLFGYVLRSRFLDRKVADLWVEDRSVVLRGM